MTDISIEAKTRREAARQKGKFGEQVKTGPQAELNVHATMMDEGATRVMPLTSTDSWYDEDTLELAAAAAERHGVQGMVTRHHLPADLGDPAARYTATLRSDLTGDSGRTFVYETGDQHFEQVTPTLSEVIAEAAAQANQQRGLVTEDGYTSALDNLIAVLGEQDARDLLAHAYLRNGPSVPSLYDDTYTVRHPAYKTTTGMSLADATALRHTMSEYLARYESVEVINERTLDRVS